MYSDFDTMHLRNIQRKFANDICKMIMDDKNDHAYGGGCKAFRTPTEWRRLGHQVPKECILILCYDGGDLRHYVSPSYANSKNLKKYNDLLKKHGLWSESANCVVDFIYKR